MRFSTASLAAVLLCASGLWIGEEAADGRGLHLALLWTLLAATIGFQTLQGRERSTPRNFHVADLGILLVAVGHVLSTWYLEFTGGDRRSAWNLTMEWTGLAAAWYTLRNICVSPRDRTLMIESLLALIVGMAILGVWQHHAAFPRNAAWYQQRRDALDNALRTPGNAALEQAREIAAELSRQGIPLEGPSRALWENRLLHSTEPPGPFALTNTLAGLLAAGLVLAVAGWSHCGTGVVQRATAGISISVIGYCLLLTKSRSAWLAAVCGLLILTLYQSRRPSLHRLLRGGIMAACLGGFLTVIAVLQGAIDREVILESPKSLQYRLLYWSGSLQMLVDRPILGPGPGNFRQAYLPYKPDESSEEILDPHNFLLEAWSSSGVTGLSGMLLFAVSLATGLWKCSSTPTTSPLAAAASPLHPRSLPGTRAASCLVLAFLLDTAWEWFSADSLQSKSDDLFLLSGAALLLLRPRLQEFNNSIAAIAAAAVVLIHLLASGGFKVPAVMLVVLVCSAAAFCRTTAMEKTTSRESASATIRWSRRIFHGATCGSFLAAAAMILISGLLPLMKSDRALDEAMSVAADQAQGVAQSAVVRNAFLKAIDSDPRRVTARQLWAEFEVGRLLSALPPIPVGQTHSTAHKAPAAPLLSAAEEACQAWLDADPAGFSAWQLRATARKRVWEHNSDRYLLDLAIDDFEQAVRRHPGQADAWLFKGELEAAAGLVSAAELSLARATRLNQINHEWGHEDQFLSAAEEQRLKLLVQKIQAPLENGRQEIPAAPTKAGQKVL